MSDAPSRASQNHSLFLCGFCLSFRGHPHVKGSTKRAPPAPREGQCAPLAAVWCAAGMGEALSADFSDGHPRSRHSLQRSWRKGSPFSGPTLHVQGPSGVLRPLTDGPHWTAGPTRMGGLLCSVGSTRQLPRYGGALPGRWVPGATVYRGQHSHW